RDEKIQPDQAVNVCVPTGNFGNILAAYFAKRIGLPVKKLICASNENKVLYDFFSTGTYDRRREFILTNSPSMDILVSSNLERLLFEVSGRNAALTAERMKSLSERGSYEISGAELGLLEEDFFAAYAGEDETVEAMYEIFEEYGYPMDTHTGVAMYAADFFREAELCIVSGDKILCKSEGACTLFGERFFHRRIFVDGRTRLVLGPLFFKDVHGAFSFEMRKVREGQSLLDLRLRRSGIQIIRALSARKGRSVYQIDGERNEQRGKQRSQSL
ncbi:MAG: hypothetical protein KH054_04660, partial [Firmicutes bacterium]|nr:hypothetical protein [Bacillota bacterium]